MNFESKLEEDKGIQGQITKVHECSLKIEISVEVEVCFFATRLTKYSNYLHASPRFSKLHFICIARYNLVKLNEVQNC